MTTPINSPVTASEEKASEQYESKTIKLISSITEDVRRIIAEILIADGRLSDDELKAKVVDLVSSLKPSLSKPAIAKAVLEGLELGITQAGLYEDMDKPTPKTKDAKSIADEVYDYSKIISATAKDALRLAKTLPVDGTYIDTIIGAVKQVENKANRAAITLANRAQAEGTILAAKENNSKLVWVNEQKSCLHCLGYAGKVVSPDKPFGNQSYDPKGFDADSLTLENPDGVKGPPLHPHCRCRLRVWDGPDPRKPEDIPTKNNNVTFPEALQREARRAVLRGDSDYDSLPQRIKAADKLLAIGANLPKTVEKRAANAVINKQFPNRVG